MLLLLLPLRDFESLDKTTAEREREIHLIAIVLWQSTAAAVAYFTAFFM